MRDAFIVHFRGSGFTNIYDGSQSIDNRDSCENTLGNTDINWGTAKSLVVTTYYKEGESCLEATITIE